MVTVDRTVIKSSFYDAYKGWRNQSRKYSRDSIVAFVFEELGRSESGPDGLRNAPWNLLLMLKWVCQDEGMTSRLAITEDRFRDLRQRMWGLMDGTTIAPDGGSSFLLFRKLLAPQLRFQTPLSEGFVRDAYIVSRLPKGSALRDHFVQTMGIEPEQLIEFSYLMFAVFSRLSRRSIATSALAPIAQAYGSEVFNSFLRRLTLDGAGLVKFFRELDGAKRKVASEYYEFPAIHRRPLFYQDGVLHCWHPYVLYRGLESLVHDALTEDQEIFRRFTIAFERYVVDQAAVFPSAEFFDEDSLKRLLPAGSRVPDGMLAFEGVNVFIESKAADTSEAFLTLGDREVFKGKTKYLAKAVEQGRSASIGIRRGDGPRPDLAAKQADYLLVITNRNIAILSGERLEEMCPVDYKLPLDECASLPAEHIFFLHADDLERLARGCVEQGRYLPEVLERCVADQKDLETMRFEFSQHLDMQGFPRAVAHVIEDHREQAFARFMTTLDLPLLEPR